MKFSSTPASLHFLLSLLSPHPLRAQSNPTPAAAHIESTQELLAHFTPQQKQQYDDAAKDFNAQRYADAFGIYKILLKDLPEDPILSKFSSESALNIGDSNFVLTTLKPIAQANPDDWQAAALLARAYAESGDKASRDAGIAHMLDLHKRGRTPPRLQQYIVERIKNTDNSLILFTSLEPWGPYHVYNYAQIFDQAGHLSLRVTLESDDADQPAFAKEHPAQSAAGARAFSFDGYSDTVTAGSGQHTRIHYTYRLLDTRPSYDAVRDTFLSIAAGQIKPVSSRTDVLSQ